MNIQNLIWSKVTVKNEATGEVVNTLDNVCALFTKGTLLHFIQYTSSRGTSTHKQLSYSYPELRSMDAQGITLKAFLWGKTAKDSPVIIELTF